MGLNPTDYKLEISDDRMIATLTLLNRDSAGSFGTAELRELLARAGVVRGIQDEQLSMLAGSPSFNEPVVIARGKFPPSRLISEVTYMFETGAPGQVPGAEDSGTEAGHEDSEDHGRIDLKQVQSFQNVREGQVLAKRTVITPAMCGEDVYGKAVEPEFKKASAPKAGRGAELDENSGTITATLTGHATVKGGKVSVMDQLDISGDVDYSVGNLDFIGNVRVMGCIHPGFHVRAGKSLTVLGNVDRAHIDCEGDLTINGIVFGAGETRISVGGDATVAALDQCEISVKGNLHVANYMRHCNAKVGGSLEILSQKGNLVGGEVHVFHNINLTSLGSKMAALTKLTVGRNPFGEANPDELRHELHEQEAKLRQITLGIEALSKRLAMGSADAETQDRLQKLRQAEMQYGPLLESLRIRLEEAQRNTAYFKEAVISVKETIHPGVVVNFRDKLQYKTMDSMAAMVFFEQEAEIKTRPLY